MQLQYCTSKVSCIATTKFGTHPSQLSSCFWPACRWIPLFLDVRAHDSAQVFAFRLIFQQDGWVEVAAPKLGYPKKGERRVGAESWWDSVTIILIMQRCIYDSDYWEPQLHIQILVMVFTLADKWLWFSRKATRGLAGNVSSMEKGSRAKRTRYTSQYAEVCSIVRNSPVSKFL